MILSPDEVAMLAINGFGAMQKQLELSALLSMLTPLQIQNILEIGIGKGGTSWALSKLDGLDRIIGVDLPNGPWGGGPEPLSLKYVSDNSQADYNLILGNSMNSECLDKVKELLGFDDFDFLFIDGDHSYAGVKTDFLTYSPLVRKGGLIGFHDICEHSKESGCEVKKFWDELKAGLPYDRYVEFISEPSTWGGIGVIKNG